MGDELGHQPVAPLRLKTRPSSASKTGSAVGRNVTRPGLAGKSSFTAQAEPSFE
jgi:hypothetical protein